MNAEKAMKQIWEDIGKSADVCLGLGCQFVKECWFYKNLRPEFKDAGQTSWEVKHFIPENLRQQCPRFPGQDGHFIA